MKKIFLIPLLACFSCVMAWAVEVSTLQGLKDAVAAGGDITLTADIDGGTNPTVTIASGKTVNLDLNGHRFYASVDVNGGLITNQGNLTIFDSGSNGTLENTKTNAGSFRRFITSSGTLWIKKGKVIAQSKMCLNAEANSTLIIGTEGGSNDDVLIESKRLNNSTPTHYDENANSAVAITTRQGSSLTIYCGTLKSNSHYTLFFDDQANVNIYNGIFTKGPEVTSWFGVNGGFVNSDLKVYGGTFPTDPTEYLSQDYYAQLEDGVYNIYRMSDPIVSTVYTLNDIKTQLAQATATQAVYMTLGADIVLNEKIELPHSSQLTIPAGRTLTVQDGGLFVNDGRTINNGTISIVDNGFFSKPASVEGTGSIVISGYVIIESAGVVNYAISNAMQLQYLAYLVLQDAYEDKTWNIALTTDINMPTEANFETIRSISGTFDGQRYSINNFTAKGSLFAIFQGHMKNVTFNNATIVDGGAVLCGYIDHNSIFENITLNGTSSAVEGAVAGFIATAENITSAGRSYGMQNADDYLWFVNCVNNINATASGSIAGGFIGTMSGAKGTIGFYNCSNKGNVTSNAFAGALLGYGMADANIDVIAFKNAGTITGPSNSANWKVGGVNYVGYDDQSYTETYLDANTYTAVYDESLGKYVAKEAGTIDNTNSTTTDWATNTTWTDEDDTTPVVPTEADNVTVNSTVVVNDGTDAVANNVSVAASQKLTVKEGASLTVGEGLQIAAGATVTVEEGATLVVGADGITGDGNLVVEATQAGGTGVVLVDPAATAAKARPEASVELIPDAYKVSEDVYKHRYIGIPLYFEGTEEFTSANWEREAIQDGESVVSHAKIWNNGWQDVTSVNEFVPFKGYALTNESTHGVKYTFKGKLVGNGDGTMNFAYGFNLFANSYTAPINIQTLLNGLSNDVKATIYMFKNDKLQTVSKADFAGFRTPKFTVIPSLQAFFVLMDDGTSATEDINYAEAVYNNSLPNSGLYAPKRQETPDFNRVHINIAAENGASDEVYLIEAADYTNNFENGFDEVKYMNNGLNLFATTAYGRQSTEITNDLNGTFIGVQGNGTYTMTFDELVGEEYQIRDLQTNAVVAMSEANTYTFTANDTNDARFVVEAIAKTPTAVDNVNDAKMFINNNTLYISENNSDANVMVYAANGQLVLSTTAQQTISLNGLANGVYTVRVANQTLKFVK